VNEAAAPADGRDEHRVAVGAGLALILAAGAIARFWGIGFGLPHTQARPDETQVMDVALSYLRGHAWPEFYDYPRFYNYLLVLAYLGYYAVAAIAGRFSSLAGFVLSWTFDWAPFFLVNRSLSALSGILTIAVVYAIGRRVRGPATGLVAAFFMALAYGHVRDSHFGTTDTTLILLCACSVLCLLTSGGPRWGWRDVTAGALAGLATATKYNGVILLVPLGIAHLLYAGTRMRPSKRLAALVDSRALAVGTAFALTFAVGIPFVFFDYANFHRAVVELSGSLGVNPAVRGGVNGWWLHLSVSLRYGLGLPLLAGGLAGICITAWRNWRTALLLFAFPVAYFIVAGWFSLQFVRYAWPILPFLCVGAAVAVTAATERVGGGRRRQALLTALLAVATVAPSAASVVAFDQVIAETDSRVLATRWLAQNAEAGASVVVSGTMYGYPQLGTRFRSWYWSRQKRAFVFRGRRAEGQPDWILLQESPLPSWTQPAVTDLLNTGYERVMVIRAFDPRATGNYYDRRDTFFVPLSAFEGVRRPGPNFTIFKRPGARYAFSPAPDRER
jgi:4-amino-4-deoxy-L-arabinose transferase-like glycosyltransferase